MANRYAMNEQYFTGSQASIFIGDIWVDDIVDWQCSVSANSMPIYGYGSTFWSHAAQGRVLVQGSFSINFREPNYLFAILAKYRENDFNFSQNYNENIIKQKKIDKNNPYAPAESFQEKSFVDKRQSLDDFFYRGSTNTSADNKRYANGRRSIYGDGVGEDFDATDTNFFKDYTNVVSSKITEESRLDGDRNTSRTDFAIPTFNIKIGYGAVLDANTVGEQIIDVKLVGKGKVLMANGEAVKESYSFFAKNVV